MKLFAAGTACKSSDAVSKKAIGQTTTLTVKKDMAEAIAKGEEDSELAFRIVTQSAGMSSRARGNLQWFSNFFSTALIRFGIICCNRRRLQLKH